MNIQSKLSVLFTILALTTVTGCAAEAGSEDGADTTAPAEQTEDRTGAPSDSNGEHAAPAGTSQYVRGAQLGLPEHQAPGGNVVGTRDLSSFAKPPQPCPQAEQMGVE